MKTSVPNESPESRYQRLFAGKTDPQCAAILVQDLIGYRKTSLSRAEDLDRIIAAFVVVRRVTS
jgi:hypothetical protein